MKTILLLIACLVVSTGYAQKKPKEVFHYILPEFVKGNVLMKTGKTNQAMINYNALTEEMIFDSNGKKLAMTQLEDVDTVFIAGRKFVPYQNKFAEVVYHNKYDLLVLHKATILDPGKPAAYGGTTQTSSVTSYSSILVAGQAYQLELPEGIETKPSAEMLIRKDGKLISFLNLRQLTKQFDDKSDQIKKFTKENKVKYEDIDSLIKLIRFIEQN